ncbi:MAG: hypothetical protein FE78DRAFT_34565 [Acidomyces sp. 'richmondensis']|nr:MAG: hypothetical protein FE78DRAFT_34565 [Acidomyces sp. 'richmondensis']
MPELHEEQIRQIPSPLPPLPDPDILSAEQWGTLCAIADTVVPSITPLEGNRLLQQPVSHHAYESSCSRLERALSIDKGSELVKRYLAESATAEPEFKKGISRIVNLYLHSQAKKELLFVLNALNTRAGSLLFTGYASPIDCQPVHIREKILQSWATARLPLFRKIHKSFTTLFKILWIRTSPILGRLLGYPRTPVHSTPPNSFFPFTFLQIPFDGGEPEVIETDVVIVGSGCGGAVAAKTLAEGGLRVIVVDKSYYWPPDHLPMSENEGINHLFLTGGSLQSDDSSIAVLAGSAWGGGGTVNWSASLQTQGFVRREWSYKFGLRYFTSASFQADLDAVCERMGVGTAAIEHNKGNEVLLEGARQLGWSAKAVPQNTGGEAHNCGYCTMGCGSCGKKGPTETFLPDAARAGATFLEGFEAQKVLFSEGQGRTDRIATGIQGVWTSRDKNGGLAGPGKIKREVLIKASKIVLSAGTLSTPLILHQSGVKNAHIGRHLHLHPVSFCSAVWDEDVRPWEGSILTSVVNEFENMDGEGYGTKLEATAMLPSVFLPLFPWKGGLEFKEFAAKMKRMTGYISLTRDRYGGQVYPDPVDGHLRVSYTPSRYDKSHTLEGVARLAELLYVMGAREIHTLIPLVEPFVRPHDDASSGARVDGSSSPSSNDAGFQAWVQRLRSIGFVDCTFASAHQMGTCRMGTTASNSVVDPNGRVWGTQGLYVCDASVFPSASGVNPMITNMAISRGIARHIVAIEVEGMQLLSKAKL